MQLKRGIFLMALGHVNYYKMALTLAVSIKQVDPTVKIAIGHTYPNEKIDPIFDQSFLIPEKAYNTDGQTEYIKAKLYMYDLSPFDETIFLDVDMIWLAFKPVSELFTKLKDVDWTIQNTSWQPLKDNPHSVWAKTDEVRKAYKLDDGRWYNFHSEFVYFKRSDKVKAFYDRAKEIYEKPLITGTNFGGARLADELALQIASVQMEFYPHEENFCPIFWYARETKMNHMQPYTLGRMFYAYSVGGNHQPRLVKYRYGIITKYHFQKAGRQDYPYQLKDKRSFIPERKNV